MVSFRGICAWELLVVLLTTSSVYAGIAVTSQYSLQQCMPLAVDVHVRSILRLRGGQEPSTLPEDAGNVTVPVAEAVEDPLIHAWGGEGHGAFGGNQDDDLKWEDGFKRFLEYKKALPSGRRKRRMRQFPSKGTPLRQWIDQQRRLYKHGELEESRQR